MDGADADLAARPGVAVGHHDRAALVAGGVERRSGGVQRVRDGEVAAADEPEERLDPAVGERASDRFGNLHRSTPPPVPPLAPKLDGGFTDAARSARCKGTGCRIPSPLVNLSCVPPSPACRVLGTRARTIE